MDIFTQKKLLVRIIILLTVINLFSIGVFLGQDIFRKPPPVELFKDRPEVKRDVLPILEKELNLNGKQSEQMRKLRSVFSEKEKALQELIQGERDSMNAVMFAKSTDEELVKSLARRISDNEYKMEILRFEQAQELKSICTPEQLEKFESLIKEIRDYFRTDRQPPKRF